MHTVKYKSVIHKATILRGKSKSALINKKSAKTNEVDQSKKEVGKCEKQVDNEENEEPDH